MFEVNIYIELDFLFRLIFIVRTSQGSLSFIITYGRHKAVYPLSLRTDVTRQFNIEHYVRTSQGSSMDLNNLQHSNLNLHLVL